MTFPECVLVPRARLSFSSVFPARTSSCDSPPFGQPGSLRSPLPPTTVPPAPAGALAAWFPGGALGPAFFQRG
jgi:hypothetical protein